MKLNGIIHAIQLFYVNLHIMINNHLIVLNN